MCGWLSLRFVLGLASLADPGGGGRITVVSVVASLVLYGIPAACLSLGAVNAGRTIASILDAAQMVRSRRPARWVVACAVLAASAVAPALVYALHHAQPGVIGWALLAAAIVVAFVGCVSTDQPTDL